MAKIVKSLATSKPYVEMQARVYPGGILHIQGRGFEANRSYGIAVNVPLSASTLGYMDRAPIGAKSMASTGAKYVLVQARPRVAKGMIHFQVNDGPGGTRAYGTTFDVPRKDQPELFVWLMQELVNAQED